MAKFIAPTLAIGAPYVPSAASVTGQIDAQGNQTIPEKAYVIGKSGKVYTTISEKAPEILKVVPTVGPFAPMREAGMQQAATGQILSTGGLDPNDPAIQARIASGDVSFDPATGAITSKSGYVSPVATTPVSTAAPMAQPAVSTDPLEAQRQAQQAAINARGGVATATQGQLQANADVVASQSNQVNANQGVVNATQGTFAPRANQITAQGQVIGAQEAQTAVQRAQIQQVQQADAARLAAEQGIQAAASNVGDQAAVAAAQNARANEAYKYQIAGQAVPQEIQVNPGQTVPNLPGVQGKLETKADYLTRTAAASERLRSIQLDQAQQIVNLAGTDTAAAQQAAARVGLTLDQAQLLVAQAQNAASQAGVDVQGAQNKSAAAGINVDQANLAVYNAATALEQAKIPPAGVPAGYQVVTNPFTGQSSYMSAADAAVQQNADKMQMAQMLNSQTPLAAFSDGQLLSIYAQGISTGVQQDAFEEGRVSAELQRRGYTQAQAHAILLQAQVAAAAGKQQDAIDAAIAAAIAKSLNS